MDQVRLRIPLEQLPEEDGELWPPASEEIVPAQLVGADTYTITAPPIFSESVNMNDLVLAPSAGTPEMPTLKRLIKASGYQAFALATEAEGAWECNAFDKQVLLKTIRQVGE